LRRGVRWRCEQSNQTAGICSRLVNVHLAKESARLPLKRVDVRTAVLSTHPLPSHHHPTIYHQHLNNPTFVKMFHPGNAPAFLSCGEEQTAAQPEATTAAYAAAIPLDWNESGPVTVSTGLLWDMRGYSRFVVTNRLYISRHIRRVAGCQCPAGRARDYQRRGAQPRLQLFIIFITLPQ
jgi:hypothetical protein